MSKKYHQLRVYAADLAVIGSRPGRPFFTITVPPPPEDAADDDYSMLQYEDELRSHIENVVLSGVLFDFALVGDGVAYGDVFISEDEPDYGDGTDPEGRLAYKLRIIAELMAPRSLEADRNQAIQEFLDKLRSLPEPTPSGGEL